MNNVFDMKTHYVVGLNLYHVRSSCECRFGIVPKSILRENHVVFHCLLVLKIDTRIKEKPMFLQPILH